MRQFVHRMPFLNKVLYSWFVREKIFIRKLSLWDWDNY